MRGLLLALGLSLSVGCGEKSSHPEAAPACDPALMDCRSYTVPPSGSVGGEPQGGAGAAEASDVTDWPGSVIAYRDDLFDGGLPFKGSAEVSAAGLGNVRVKAQYDGSEFELKGVLKTEPNWFLVTPEANAGVLPTLTPADTRTPLSAGAVLGVAREQDVEAIFQLSLSGSERSATRAQVVVKVVDDQARVVTGVEASAGAEVTAYRTGDIWTMSEGLGTDESGLIFLGNVPASSTLSSVNVLLLGQVSARVEAKVLAGAVTVLTVVVSPP